ncbi:Asp23/Gls24 family envelope stress response protein [Streptomyces sp. NRRL F-5650]|uniref:Asp23/Gls24 family envelope stress response protein n=1 Tax=Streptomyces sp. NRRL F-5650 TaxID=1463868 RepID=UPI0004C4C00F|nr:Asp23/Gls24 family envelope stress response protein [Streptomyces sp. NRRL F-5650]
MTEHTAGTPHSALAEELAAAVTDVPGVAFLRPGLTDRLRGTLSRPARNPAGVRVTRPDGAGPWHVEIHVVALRQARTVEVARGVRDAVGRRLDTLAPAGSPPRVTVTVTGLL